MALTKAFPGAPVYTSVYNAAKLPGFKKLDVRTSFLQSWPLARRKHQLYPMLRTIAFESFNFSNYDVVITTNSAESKGVITSPNTLHINYIFTPTRYYWSGYLDYLANPGFGSLNGLVRLVMPGFIARMRRWDFAAAQRADTVVAISDYVATRVSKYYSREASTLYPPVNVERFDANQPREDFYLVVSRLIPYKRVDLAVAACKKLNVSLVVIGDGSERSRLEAMAGPYTKFLGHLADSAIADYYSRAKMFIFTSDEDFGITPLEAMASGAPVIAYGQGGALETVIDGETGTFFAEQTVDSLIEAIKAAEVMKFAPTVLRAHAEKFSEQRFIDEFRCLVHDELAKR